MVRKQIHLTSEQNDFLEGLEGIPVAEHIRRAVDNYIEKKKSVLVSTSRSRVTHVEVNKNNPKIISMVIVRDDK